MKSNHYRIMGNYRNKTEEIDHAFSKKKAIYLQNEYQIAFGYQWNVWVEDESGTLDLIYPLYMDE